MDETNDTRRDAISVGIKGYVDDKCVDIKEIMNARFKALETKIQAQQEATQRAVDRAESDYNTRFASTNEWRFAFKDREANFITREELKTLIEKVNQGISRAEHDALIAQVNSKNDAMAEALGEKSKALEAKISEMGRQMMAMIGGLLVIGITLAIEIWSGSHI